MNSLLNLLAVALLLPFVALSQHEADNWYFGDSAALSFAGGAPVALTNSNMSIQEGATSVSDQNGQLLFYCDGMSVWNRQHQVMPNGMDLHGDQSAAQATLAIPFPGHPGQYYLFTVGGVGDANGLQFSIIDMSLDGGLGDITQKNNQLVTPVTEKLSAVRHCNGKDLWIIVHQAGTGTGFFAYLLTNNGINPSPVVSNVEGVSNTGGQLKISPNGKKMAAANPYQPFSTVLFDFDNQTGTVSNPITLLQLNYIDIVYGVEFSPNSSFLYTTLHISNYTQPSQRAVLKYNVTLPTATDIIASRDTVFIETLSSLGNANLFGSMQLGPDKKIYISPIVTPYLAVIPNPDSPGKAAGFDLQGVYLGGKIARLGLPNFPASFIVAPLSSKRIDTVICRDQSIVLNADPTATSFLWQDGTTAASTTVTSPGLYWVQETSTNGCLIIDSFNVSQKLPPAFTLGMDTVICREQDIVLEPVLLNNNPIEAYQWQDGSTQPQFTIVSAGTYSLQATNSCGATSDTIVITNGVCRLMVPNAFTPNGDGRNERFRAFFGENVVSYSLQIYNRWGQRVFTSNSKNEGWDGTLHGHAQPADTYTWVIRYKVLNNMRDIFLKGTLLLIR